MLNCENRSGVNPLMILHLKECSRRFFGENGVRDNQYIGRIREYIRFV